MASEIKASGFVTQEEIQDYEKFNQDFLDSKPAVEEEERDVEEEEKEDYYPEMQKEYESNEK